MPRPSPTPDEVIDRFWSKVEIDWETGCWEWRGHFGGSQWAIGGGYGRISIWGSGRSAHRTAWIIENGSIPEGLQIDHLCRNRGCVNPEHLEPVTAKVNTLRSLNPAAVNARKTHCPQGHPYDSTNTLWGASGDRHCRACRKIYDRRRRAA